MFAVDIASVAQFIVFSNFYENFFGDGEQFYKFIFLKKSKKISICEKNDKKLFSFLIARTTVVLYFVRHL